MTAYNVVRFRVKAGREKEFVDAHKNTKMEVAGFRKATLIKTGERTYCFVGEWDSQEAIVAARPKMIGILDGLRGTLEDLGDGLGVTDSVSGPAVVEIKPGR